jgi:poly-gamma-glutamate capsule biosynthesis protein CapA/YwtB (metallophosphatase superfamily)
VSHLSALVVSDRDPLEALEALEAGRHSTHLLDGNIKSTAENRHLRHARDGRVSSQQLDRNQLVRRQPNRRNWSGDGCDRGQAPRL